LKEAISINTLSAAGEVGLMQIVPSIVSRILTKRGSDNERVSIDVKNNIEMKSAYLIY
jgi:hypothetical protein